MQTIVLLMGPHGSGKSSLAETLHQQGSAIRLSQYTTRLKRDGEGDEYIFTGSSQADALWRYVKAGSEYGFARSELAKLPDGQIGIVAVHTEVIDSLKDKPLDIKIVTVGLDTVTSHDEQLSRVNHIEGRVQSDQAFEESRRIARCQDVCLSGDFDSVSRELIQIVKCLGETCIEPRPQK